MFTTVLETSSLNGFVSSRTYLMKYQVESILVSIIAGMEGSRIKNDEPIRF